MRNDITDKYVDDISKKIAQCINKLADINKLDRKKAFACAITAASAFINPYYSMEEKDSQDSIFNIIKKHLDEINEETKHVQ